MYTFKCDFKVPSIYLCLESPYIKFLLSLLFLLSDSTTSIYKINKNELL